MIHYSCDCCGRPLRAEDDLRYVVKMVIQAIDDSMPETDDSDRDHLMEIHDKLESQEAFGDEEIPAKMPGQASYDLCSECHKRFAQDPFGREFISNLHFSQN